MRKTQALTINSTRVWWARASPAHVTRAQGVRSVLPARCTPRCTKARQALLASAVSRRGYPGLRALRRTVSIK